MPTRHRPYTKWMAVVEKSYKEESLQMLDNFYHRLMDHIESVAGITQLGDCLIRAAMSIEKYMACRQQFLAYLKLSSISVYALNTRARGVSL